MSDQKSDFRSGIVAIVGRPNVGKSTLLNKILGEKVAIVSAIPQTTRNSIRGIFNHSRGQIVFVDTPGIHFPSHKLGKHMVNWAKEAIAGSDLVIHLVDTNEPPGEEEELAVEQLKDLKAPVVLGLNKIDLGAKFIPRYIELWEAKKKKPIKELDESLILFTLSGLKGTNIDKLVELIFSHLPKGPALYPEDLLSDIPMRFAVAEIIREKLFALLRQEIPHHLAVLVEEMIERTGKLTYIKAHILVEKDSQKIIVVGKHGNILKEAGEKARKEIEVILEKKVYLELWVKVEAGWRQDPLLLKRLGYII